MLEGSRTAAIWVHRLSEKHAISASALVLLAGAALAEESIDIRIGPLTFMHDIEKRR